MAIITYNKQGVVSENQMCIRDSLSTVRNADCIVVLEQGRIIERGSHDAVSYTHLIWKDLGLVNGMEDEEAALDEELAALPVDAGMDPDCLLYTSRCV